MHAVRAAADGFATGARNNIRRCGWVWRGEGVSLGRARREEHYELEASIVHFVMFALTRTV